MWDRFAALWPFEHRESRTTPTGLDLNLVREHGGVFTEAKNPVAVLVRSPAEARRIIEAIDSGEAVRTPFASSCLKDQQPGDRAVVYESGKEGSGLVAWIDFCGPVADNDQWRHGAQSAMQRMSPEIGRTELLEDPELRPIFLHIRGQQWLSPEAASAIARRSPPPPFLWLPVDETWDLSTDWDAADPGNAWGLESGMQKVVAADARCRATLGLGSSPATEIRSDDHRDRYDLIARCGAAGAMKIARRSSESPDVRAEPPPVTGRREGGPRYAAVIPTTTATAIRAAIAAQPWRPTRP